MKITKNNNIVIETTNRAYGMLEQGGVCGRKVSYPLDKVMAVTGFTRKEIENIENPHEFIDNDDEYPVSLSQLINLNEIQGRVICKGEVIK